MRHVFKGKKLGWGDDKTEGVWFDADHYTKEEAEAEFKPYQRGASFKNEREIRSGASPVLSMNS